MNVDRFVLAALGVFVFFFLFGFLWHGVVMRGMYMATASVWRPEAEMNQFFYWALLSRLALAFIIAFIFTRHYEEKGLGEGLRYGAYVGLFMGIMQFGFYPYLPIPLSIAVAWFIGSLVEGVAAGAVLSLVYRRA